MNPDYTFADAGQGARLGQQIALAGTSCHGDVLPIQHQFECLANTMARIAQGDKSRFHKLQARWDKEPSCDRAGEQLKQFGVASEFEFQSTPATEWYRRAVPTRTGAGRLMPG